MPAVLSAPHWSCWRYAISPADNSHPARTKGQIAGGAVMQGAGINNNTDSQQLTIPNRSVRTNVWELK